MITPNGEVGDGDTRLCLSLNLLAVLNLEIWLDYRRDFVIWSKEQELLRVEIRYCGNQ